MHGCVKHPRRIKHLAAVQDYLEGLGATVGPVRQSGHLHISYVLGGVARQTAIATSPRSVEACVRQAKQRLRRDLRAGEARP